MGFIEKTTTKIIKDGISRFAKQENIEVSEAQIAVSLNGEQVVYRKCKNWAFLNQVKFSDILGMADLMNLKQTADAFMVLSIMSFSEELQAEPDNITAYLYLRENVVCVSVYVKGNSECRKALPLWKHFANMEIE